MKNCYREARKEKCQNQKNLWTLERTFFFTIVSPQSEVKTLSTPLILTVSLATKFVEASIATSFCDNF